MINENISNGDYVLINKQSKATIGDVATVDIDGNATLNTREWVERILLIPENNAHEPILTNERWL